MRFMFIIKSTHSGNPTPKLLEVMRSPRARSKEALAPVRMEGANVEGLRL
jgi:hypothetical protein